MPPSPDDTRSLEEQNAALCEEVKILKDLVADTEGPQREAEEGT